MQPLTKHAGAVVVVVVALTVAVLWADWRERGGYEPVGYYLRNLALSSWAEWRGR